MTITASLFEEMKGPLCSGPFACLRATQRRFFNPVAKSADRSSDCFRGLHGWPSMRNGPAGEQGRFPGSVLLSSALASKDQGGSPDHASRLFALGSMRTHGQTLLCPSHDRDHPWRESQNRRFRRSPNAQEQSAWLTQRMPALPQVHRRQSRSTLSVSLGVSLRGRGSGASG